MSTRCERSSCDGFEAFVLTSDELSVAVVPSLGGRIVSLRHRRGGREWMWRPPGGRLFRNHSGDSFGNSTLTGADECFPTVPACSIDGRELPDHGELWPLAWEVERADETLALSVQAPGSPFRFSRTLGIERHDLVLDYRLRNESDANQPWLWAFHPLLSREQDDVLELATPGVRVDSALGGNHASLGDRWAWPEPFAGCRLDRFDFGEREPSAVKVFSEPLEVGHAVVRNALDGERLEFHFSLSAISCVGLWINRGGWEGYDHFAIEPSTGAPDSLRAAIEWNRYRTLAAGAEETWQLRLRITPPQ